MICSLGFKKFQAVHQLFLWCNKRFIILLSVVVVYSCLLLIPVRRLIAFDCVDRTFFRILIDRNTPQCLIRIINYTAVVRWNGVLSYSFNVSCGVRQGGALSPFLFKVYVDDLLCQLELHSLGCCIKMSTQYALCMHMIFC